VVLANRTGRNVSLVMLDLDHFKHFNDTFGHQVGDVLLREVAGVLTSRVRTGGLACRYRGEGFSLILAEVDTEGTYKCIENIRESIKTAPFVRIWLCITVKEILAPLV
jgi:diguanylate cyclase (GGDEF)-like protein